MVRPSCSAPPGPALIDIAAWRAKPAWRLDRPTVNPRDFAALLRQRAGGGADLAQAANFRTSKMFDANSDDTVEATHAQLLKQMKAARRKPTRNYELHSPRRGSTTIAPCDDRAAALPVSRTTRRAFGGTYQPTRPLSPPDVLWPPVLPSVLPSLMETGWPWSPLAMTTEIVAQQQA